MHQASTPTKEKFVDCFPMPPQTTRNKQEWDILSLFAVGNNDYRAPADVLLNIESFETKLIYLEILDCEANYSGKLWFEKKRMKEVTEKVVCER